MSSLHHKARKVPLVVEIWRVVGPSGALFAFPFCFFTEGKNTQCNARYLSPWDDLTLMANGPVALQTMLNRLHAYAQRKHLIINTAKSE
eukprot:451569-Pelagomonas_calceolata.AAC.1